MHHENIVSTAEFKMFQWHNKTCFNTASASGFIFLVQVWAVSFIVYAVVLSDGEG